jgi:hypothetical protein
MQDFSLKNHARNAAGSPVGRNHDSVEAIGPWSGAIPKVPINSLGKPNLMSWELINRGASWPSTRRLQP